MWPRRKKHPKVAKTVFGAYLRARLVGASIGLDGEADLYASDDVPLPLRVAFAVGVASKRRAPIMTEGQVERKVAELLDLRRLVDELEGGDDSKGGSTPPPPPPPVAVPVVATASARVRPTPWIGDPLPATGS